ncbi:hypothetical protein lerEdw1_015883 [Lerista edwardsae]|nr:hypothetical protein lerEdw1_015883 [Lerista edwardsae]
MSNRPIGPCNEAFWHNQHKATVVTHHQTGLFLREKQVNVIVCYADSEAMLTLAALMRKSETTVGKVWIAVSLQDLSLRLLCTVAGVWQLHGSLSFSIQGRKCTEYDNFDTLISAISVFGGKAFRCFYSRPGLAVKGWTRCIEKEKRETLAQDVLESVLSQDSYSIYNTVQAVARALHAAFASRPLNRRVVPGARRLASEIVQPWQVVLFPRRDLHSPSSVQFQTWANLSQNVMLQ